MFGLFKKDPSKKLMKKYDKLMQEAFELSRTNRRLADRKHAEADAIMKRIEELKHAV